MQKIVAEYLQTSPRFIGNQKSFPDGKGQDISFMDIFKSRLNSNDTRKNIVNDTYAQPKGTKTILNQQNNPGIAQKSAVKERRLFNNKESKSLELDEATDKSRTSEDKRSVNPEITALAALKDVLTLLELLNDQNDSETFLYANENKLEGSHIETGDISLTEALKLVRDKLIELKKIIGNIEDTQPKIEFDNILSNINKLLNKNLLSSESGIEFEVLNTDINPEEVLAQLKSNCSEIIDKLQKTLPVLRKENVSTLETGINRGIGAIDEETDFNVIQDSINGNEREPATIKTDVEDTSKVSKKAVSDENEGNMNKSQTENVITEDTAFEDMVQMNSSAPYENRTVSMTENKSTVHVAGMEKPIDQAVTSQVMTKVKLMAGEAKQEMEMELEPESLGKLTLKIVHEKGEILAKITAESEQVKQILESNMQMLKDSLEENGFSVQSLSVSVGNGRKEQAEEHETKADKSIGKIKTPEKRLFVYSEQKTPYVTATLSNLYSDSQIDLTA
ncbi:MAG: flagellar hook-length control protein FliK [Clostridiaceae bacterium]|nr:flagellar hook-length control protein FliK [Clostridiaceae bacterium]